MCSKCGAYVGAVMEDEGRLIATLNVNSLDIRDTFDPAPPLHVYDGEDEAAPSRPAPKVLDEGDAERVTSRHGHSRHHR